MTDAIGSKPVSLPIHFAKQADKARADLESFSSMVEVKPDPKTARTLKEQQQLAEFYGAIAVGYDSTQDINKGIKQLEQGLHEANKAAASARKALNTLQSGPQ